MLAQLPTIAAISSAAGSGGVACIRVSGSQSYTICNIIFKAGNKRNIETQTPRKLYFGEIIDGDSIVDEVLLSRFVAPHSYTGENTVEITCHGSVFIQQKIIELLVKNGAALAKAGEFTQRAFLNGKLDLSQAEAVADLIASESAASHRLALNQMRGGVSNELQKLRSQLLNFASLIELELDFSEEDVEFADRSQLQTLANHVNDLIKGLADTFSAGNAIKNGIPVAIVGETNAGKSTLLNLLLKEERAIVSDIHGTTRDAIEDTTVINGQLFRFIDTAGIRETLDTIENIGIERTFKKLEQASIVLWLIDSLSSMESIAEMAKKIVPICSNKQLIVILNKIDLLDSPELDNKELLIRNTIPCSQHLSISAISQKGISRLIHILTQSTNVSNISENNVIISNVRHYNALMEAYSALQRVIGGLNSGTTGDFLSQDIRECLHHLGEITGEISTDEILGNIFSKFCIGK